MAAKDQIPQQTDTLKPGETRVYPSMLAEKQVPVLDLTNSTVTSEADLQTAFHSLNLCSTEKEDCKMLFTRFLPPDCARCFLPVSLQFAGFLVSYLVVPKMCAGLGELL